MGGGTGSGGGGSGGGSGSSGSTLRGSVGDGPVVNATITVLDNTGAQVATGNSDSNANYEIVVPAGTAYPITVVTNAEERIPSPTVHADVFDVIGGHER